MLFLSAFATGLVLNAPVLAPRAAVAKMPISINMNLVEDVKDSLVPTNVDQTFRNVIGLQMTGWGAASLLIPTMMATKLMATTLSPATVPLMRGTGLVLLSLGAITCKGSDSDAAVSGFLFYGMWYHLLKTSGYAGYAPQIMLWNAACALSCARRQGGLFETVTKLDTGALSSLLPRDRNLSLRNVLGVQCLGWGVMSMFFGSMLTGSRFINAAVSGTMVAGTGLAHILLAGKVFGGSDSDAATTGLVTIGGWGVIAALARNAGLWSGSLLTATIAWNLAFAAYCVKEKL